MHFYFRTIIVSFYFIVNSFTIINAQSGTIKGQVVDNLTNQAILFANVVIPGSDIGTTTDENGLFEIRDLTPGIYDLRVTYVGYKDNTVAELIVTSAKPTEIVVKMEEQSLGLNEVVVKASPFTKKEESPISVRTIGVAEIQRNPGANRDISKVVQSLPGVTSASSFRNDLIIRGGAPNENRFYLDDVEVPNINHFATQGSSGGPVGLINVNFIREVDFFSSAYPVNRGNTLSSVLNFKQVDGRKDRIGGTFMFGASDAGLSLDGPLGDKTSFLISARRSYLQFLFKALELPFLPTYNDFQVKVKHKFDNKNELTFIGLGAIDNFVLNLDANKTESQLFLLDNIPVNNQWNYTNGLVYKHYRDKGFYTVVLSRNMLNNTAEKYYKNQFGVPDALTLKYKSQEIENKLRIENTLRSDDININFGVSAEFVKYNNATFNKIFIASGPFTIDYSSDFSMIKYAAFGQASKTFLNDKLTLSVGMRMDGNDYSDRMNNPINQLSPRASLSYIVANNLEWNVNIGRYFQLPPYTVLGYKQKNEFINKANIDYIHADHFVTGFSYTTKTSSKFSIEAYYKKYNDYPFLLNDSISLANLGSDFGVIGNEPAISNGQGRSYGLELLFQQRLFKGYYGIANYTLGWSEFKNKNDVFVPSSWDARHIINVTFGKKFKRNWEAGIKWRFQTGLPFTPFSDQSSLVSNWDVSGLGKRDFNKLNSERLGNSSTIDIRIDKRWYYNKWALNIYLDLQNITSNAVPTADLILDRPLDDNGTPIGGGIIENPDAPYSEQRYKLKLLEDGQGNLLPSIGLMIEF